MGKSSGSMLYNELSPKVMAAEINGYPKGTVSHVYTTSDGGFNYGQLVAMEAALREAHIATTGN